MRRLIVPLLIAAVLSACEKSPTEVPPNTSDYRVGSLVRFNVNTKDACINPDHRTGRVIALSQRAIIVSDTANPQGAGTYTDEEYQNFGQQFDQLVWPTLVTNFGEPQDVDRNQRVIIFFTRAVNELTPRNQEWYVGGFFFARDLFPRTAAPGFEACPGSNHAEMMYMLVPDPQGVVNGNARLKERELRSTVAVIAHEFQHLINASRRLYVVRAGGANWNEETWLNEGLSHIAEELTAYAASTLVPRQNIDADRLTQFPSEQAAFFAYQSSNVTRLAEYLKNPDTTSINGVDGLATRGAAWSFLRYAADRRVAAGTSESVFWRSLIDSNNIGFTNLQSSISAEPMDWINDWLVASYAADLVPGLEARYQLPSWNFRSIYPRLRSAQGQLIYGHYPLRVRTVQPLVENRAEIAAGSAAYFRFAVAPGGTAQLRLNGSAGECQTFSLDVGQVRTFVGTQAGAICLGGGSGGAEYTYIPVFTTTTPSSRLSIQLTAVGISALPSSSSAFALSEAAGIPVTSNHEHTTDPAREWEIRLRERTAQQLAGLVRGGSAPVFSTSFAGGVPLQTVTTLDSRVRVSIVRVR